MVPATYAVVAAFILAGSATAQEFVPPYGYSGQAPVRPAQFPEPGAPLLTRLPDSTLATAFHLDPHYRRIARARAKVVGAFAVEPPRGVALVAAWGAGFLPVTLSFSDGRCFALRADYTGGMLSNGRLAAAPCIREQVPPKTVPQPADKTLRLIGDSWGHAAWVDRHNRRTIVTAPTGGSFEPLFTADMAAVAMMGLGLPDYPGGTITLVGTRGKRTIIVTLDVSY